MRQGNNLKVASDPVEDEEAAAPVELEDAAAALGCDTVIPDWTFLTSTGSCSAVLRSAGCDPQVPNFHCQRPTFEASDLPTTEPDRGDRSEFQE